MLTRPQVEALLRPINPRRVLKDNKGMSHVSQQDVRAHLTRIFGFGGWSTEVIALDLVREDPGKDRQGKDKGWAVTYRCVLRLTVRDPQGQELARYEDAATGTSPNLPTLGDSHDFAAKVAVSMALKRCATNLGDGFGLSLYNKGQTDPLVIGTLVMPDGPGKDAHDEVPQQVSMGHDDAGSQEAS
ncbi:MAG TPA: Rad52/Rad22 family DNA repair protein [Miltoncostaeaceae bacterium]|nr:Rad52/Rad22 family DNA repair protein [Miltoncostaeaceae bacterium]